MARLEDVIGYGTHAARPAAGSAGSLYYETDTDTLFRDNGTTWDALALSATPALVKLGEVVVGIGGQATIAFSSIVQTYRSLRLDLVARGDAAANEVDIRIRFNGDTAANYDWEVSGSSGTTTPAAQAGTGVTFGVISYCSGASSAANQVGTANIDIPNYSDTTWYKRAVGASAYQYNTGAGSLNRHMTAVDWKSAAAITSILLLPSSGNFVAGSVASLYGVL